MTEETVTPLSTVEAMCRDFEGTSWRSPRTIRFYREELATIIRRMEEGGHAKLPQDITAEDVKWLLDLMAEYHLTVSTRKGYISALRTWTRYYGNNVVSEMQIRWPVDTRPNADWLTVEQAKELLELEKDPSQDFVVHCELCLGMRRVEVLRLRPESFHEDHVEILGKGSMGGKPRIMPYHRDTMRVYSRYMEYRNAAIALVRTHRADVEVPESMMLYARGMTLKTYTSKGTGIDAMLKGLADQLGVHFSNHTLRRTFGREMFRCGVEVATIAKMMGHESTETTLKYIGVDLDDMSEAMKAFAL